MSSLLLALLLSLTAPLQADDALFYVEEFERFYPRQELPGQRREAVLTLGAADSERAARALVMALRDEDYIVRRAAIDVLASYRDPAARAFLIEGVLGDRKLSKDKALVASVAEALGGMGGSEALPPLLELLEERDLDVRLGAVIGLGKLGRGEAIRPLGPLVDDKEQGLAVAALRALADIGEPREAFEAVTRGMRRPEKPVQLAAIESAERLRHKDYIAPLIEMLDAATHDPRVTEDAHEALLALTLREFPDEPETWRAWWERSAEVWELPDLERIEAARKRVAEQGARYTTGKRFQGIETKSENILFVIDVSESMDQPFDDPERLAATGRTYASDKRLDIVKEELIATIESLDEQTAFNIVSFATDVDTWKRKPARANVLNKSNARGWVEDLTPLGGTQSTFRIRAGLTALSDEAVGQTNTHLALMTAFGEPVGDERRRPRELITDVSDPLDTIFFLTDGEPTVGETTDMTEIRDEVRRVNAFRGVQLHVIYVGTVGGDAFRYMAEENGGVFVGIGG